MHLLLGAFTASYSSGAPSQKGWGGAPRLQAENASFSKIRDGSWLSWQRLSAQFDAGAQFQGIDVGLLNRTHPGARVETRGPGQVL